MAIYGYRLFTIQLMHGHKRKPVNFNDCRGEHYADVTARLLKSLSSRTMVGDPPSDASGSTITVASEAEALSLGYIDRPAFRSEDVRVTDRLVRGTILAGKFGSHEKALGAGDISEDADIRDKAACRQYRFIVALPDSGTTGILAVEDISRSCPVSPLARWLRWSSQEEAVSGSSAGNEPPWWRPQVKPLADENRLLEMIATGQAQRLELVKHYITASRTRESEEFRVSAPLVDEGKVTQVAQLVKSWMRHPSDVSDEYDPLNSTVTDADAAKQLAAIVGPKIENLDLDDGWVVLQDGDNTTKRISPSRMSEIFVYRQPGGRRLDAPQFYSKVRTRAQKLQQPLKLHIDWPAQ